MNKTPDNEKQSPLRDKPLRLPGQSGDEMLDEKHDKAMQYAVVALITVFLAWMEWWRTWLNTPPQPKTATVLAVIMVSIAVRIVLRCKAEAKNIKQGRDGERIVAEHLEKLRARGYRVLHDVVAGSFNVDHVLIGPAGIFVVETKTPSKSGRNNRIEFDGETIFQNGRPLPRNPIHQARGNAAWLNGVLKSSTTKAFWVTPMVVFPDWSVIRTAHEDSVLVLNHKEVESAVTGRKAVLNEEDIAFAAFHLERFVRTGQNKN